MTYYEELGLTESASVEEIRRAYKSLARLLHPDHQAEEQLRKAAELQMMRLNEILAMLTDPLRRGKDDPAVHPPPAPDALGEEGPARRRTQPRPLPFRVNHIVFGARLSGAA